MNVFTRIERLERHFRRPVHGYLYSMPGGSQRILSYKQAFKGFADATSGVDSIESQIVLNAVADNNNGLMLQLLHAVLNPIDT